MGQQTQTEKVPFSKMQAAIGKQFKEMSASQLFTTNVDGNELWQKYLDSFPAGSNPIFKTRTEHDCTCCRHFIRNIGGLVTISEGRISTIWDIQVGGYYQEVADALADFVRAQSVKGIYLHYEAVVGQPKTRQLLADKSVTAWDHFFVNLPNSAVTRKGDIGTKCGEFRATHDVMLRGLKEITSESLDTVLELIAQNSLYRGEEHKFAVSEFKKLKNKFAKLRGENSQDIFVWENQVRVHDAVARLRNSVIGTLLTDLSEGKDLEDAVKSFEVKVAPTNYKRPTALVTKAMVEKAQKTVNDLGLTTALERRYATLDDLTVNNLLFADRAAQRQMNVFDEITAGTAVDLKKFGKVEEVSIGDFINKILPTAKTIDILLENRHTGNMVSLVAPVDPTAKQLFKWSNGFSWAYRGDLADSIKERVKKAGGSVTGDYRASLAWYNHDDLDLHLEYPKGGHIYFGKKTGHAGKGELDVDMNAGGAQSRTPVENITFPKRDEMPEGTYKLSVNQFCSREVKDTGFEIEMEFDGVVYNFSYPKTLRHRETVEVCTFKYSRVAGITIEKSLPLSQTSKQVWNLPTQTFHKVRAALLSPNCWDNREVGNKHYFFMLENCKNEETARGFFNEFLSEELSPHRKVLEMVGARMRTDESDQQLSGLGFSSTQRNHLYCRVGGAFSRVIKVLF